MVTDYAEFVATVEREARVPHDQAEVAVAATLGTLGERISGGEAHDLAEQLPSELRDLVDEHAGEGPRRLSAREFLQRVQTRERVPIDQAEDHVRGVFAALRATLSPRELGDLASELPRELEMLLFDDPPLAELAEGEAGTPPASADEFVARVAVRAGLGDADARRATDAVLALLGRRIAAGEAEDLAQRLPAEIGASLERGAAEKPGPNADRLPLRQFLMAVAEREGGVSRGAARLHARAVLETLAEAVGDDEIGDAMSELPAEFRSLFPRRR